jgi:hypothetical protein
VLARELTVVLEADEAEGDHVVWSVGLGLPERGVRSSVVRIASIAHSKGLESQRVRHIFFKHLLSLARPAGAADRSYLPIAGDSAPTKAAVTESIESIGYSVVDAGPLADSWRQATDTPVWGTPYGPTSDEKGRPVGEDAIRVALAAATR